MATGEAVVVPGHATVLVSLLSCGVCNSHTADSDPYCCGLTGGVVICEMMALMLAFISSVKSGDYCQALGNICASTCDIVPSNTFRTSVIIIKRLLWLADLYLTVPYEGMQTCVT